MDSCTTLNKQNSGQVATNYGIMIQNIINIVQTSVVLK